MAANCICTVGWFYYSRRVRTVHRAYVQSSTSTNSRSQHLLVTLDNRLTLCRESLAFNSHYPMELVLSSEDRRTPIRVQFPVTLPRWGSFGRIHSVYPLYDEMHSLLRCVHLDVIAELLHEFESHI